MPDFEAVGDAATGAMLARAVEPRAGDTDNGHTHEANCLNCGTPLEGGYCHACGQKAHVHRTLSAFWHDLVHSVLHVDGKLWRTLPLLAWHPGELTRRYIHGERARFVSPMALFLFTVFLMFAIFSMVGLGLDNAEFRNTNADINAALAKEREDLKEHREERQKAVAERNAALAKEREDLKEHREERQKAVAERNAAEVQEVDEAIRDTQAAIASLNQYLNASASPRSEFVAGKTGWKRIDDGIKKLNDNPALALYKVQTNAYKFSWALIPISVPFVWLLFVHRRRYRQQFGAYDHTVFVTYSIAFMSLALIVMTVLKPIPGLGWLGVAIIAVPPLHMYRQLRGAYSLSRWGAAWRTVALLLMTLATITIFLFLLLALGILA